VGKIEWGAATWTKIFSPESQHTHDLFSSWDYTSLLLNLPSVICKVLYILTMF